VPPASKTKPKATRAKGQAARTPPPPGVVKISKLAALSGVPASTIKHYVRLGLLPPPVTRPNKQMAYYDPGLVDRIRAIKILQSERYLPLPTIKKLLGAPPRPGEQRSEALAAQQLPLLEPALRPPPSGWMARKQLLVSFRVGEQDLVALEAAGLIAVTAGERGEPGYADTDLEILRVVHDARAAGLEQLFPMEILEPYVGAVRQLVRLEIELFRTRVQSGAALPAGLALDEIATLSARLGERLVVALRRQLVLAEVRGAGIATQAAKPSVPRRRPGRRA
jgi:DNA-binding transcriptional MerR regulator